MKKLLKFVSAIALALSITACAGSGKINWDAARQVKPGMTQQEVTEVMGRPHRVSGRGNGVETWLWVHANGFTGSTQSASVIFKDGIAAGGIPVPNSF